MSRWPCVCGWAAFAGVLAVFAVAIVPDNGTADDSVDSTARDRRAIERIETPPIGLPPVPVPAANPPTPEKVALGRKLFFDRRMSVNSTMSCAMCHIPEQGFTNNELARPLGVGGRSLRRNAPTLLNAAYIPHAFHDGRRPTLEAQALDPLVDYREMANPDLNSVIARIAELPDYDGLFERAFGGRASPERLAQALASWERTLVAGDSPFDRWRYRGEKRALTVEQVRGFELFTGRAGCASCHRVGEDHALLTDDLFHDTGIGYMGAEAVSRDTARVPVEIASGIQVSVSRETLRSIGDPPQEDRGRFEATGDPQDRWSYKTPSLRNVALTAPYMHDGSLRSLRDVVLHYVRGGVPHEGLDPLLRPLDLTQAEVDAIVAFLEGLTSPVIAELVEDARSVEVGN